MHASFERKLRQSKHQGVDGGAAAAQGSSRNKVGRVSDGRRAKRMARLWKILQRGPLVRFRIVGGHIVEGIGCEGLAAGLALAARIQDQPSSTV